MADHACSRAAVMMSALNMLAESSEQEAPAVLDYILRDLAALQADLQLLRPSLDAAPDPGWHPHRLDGEDAELEEQRTTCEGLPTTELVSRLEAGFEMPALAELLWRLADEECSHDELQSLPTSFVLERLPTLFRTMVEAADAGSVEAASCLLFAAHASPPMPVAILARGLLSASELARLEGLLRTWASSGSPMSQDALIAATCAGLRAKSLARVSLPAR